MVRVCVCVRSHVRGGGGDTYTRERKRGREGGRGGERERACKRGGAEGVGNKSKGQLSIRAISSDKTRARDHFFVWGSRPKLPAG